MLGQTQTGRLYQSAVSSDSHYLLTQLLLGQGQMESCLVVSAMSDSANAQRLAERF